MPTAVVRPIAGLIDDVTSLGASAYPTRGLSGDSAKTSPPIVPSSNTIGPPLLPGSTLARNSRTCRLTGLDPLISRPTAVMSRLTEAAPAVNGPPPGYPKTAP